MTVNITAISHLHEILCEYKAAEELFIEVEAKYWASGNRKSLQAEYDHAEEVWLNLNDEAFALASFITNNAFSQWWFERLLNLHIDELISFTA